MRTHLIASQRVNCSISLRSYCLKLACLFRRFLSFSFWALSLADTCFGAKRIGTVEKERVIGFEAESRGERKEDVVDLQSALDAMTKPREASMADRSLY